MSSYSNRCIAPVSFRSVVGVVALSLLAVACGDLTVDPVVAGQAKANVGSALAQDAPLDVLFVVDDSSSMDDKQSYLGEAATKLLGHLVNPNCIDAGGNVVGQSSQGSCKAGKAEFLPVKDLHVGIVSTSLGLGGQESNAGPFPCANDHAHLLARHRDGVSFSTIDPSTNVFSWTDGRDLSGLEGDVQNAIDAMDEQGCGIESQLESWYRFLVQPDPPATLRYAEGAAAREVSTSGIDTTLLAQRKAFLRPGSNVVIVLLSDENDSSIDPRAVSGSALTTLDPAFLFPPATTACAASPTSDACNSCGLATTTSTDPACAAASSENEVATVTFHDRQRFGVELLYPVSRYVAGLTNPKVPGVSGEHPLTATGVPSASYVGTADCDNPIFAGALPADDSGDVCHLGRGPRDPSQVFYLTIAGVPHQLLQASATAGAGPLKAQLTDADYRTLLGNDPLAYDFSGADPHMLESLTPRDGIGDADPIVLRDFDTLGTELERACTFSLATPIDESKASSLGPCSGSDPMAPQDDPLCASTAPHLQVSAGATPAVREIALARALGYQGLVGSICPIHQNANAASASEAFTNPKGDPLFGYEPAASGLVDRMAGR